MPLPRLYILHPPEARLPGITAWLAEVQTRACGRVEWDGCEFVRDEYDLQASFSTASVSDKVKRRPGPVVLIQKVQHSARNRLEELVGRVAQVISAHVWDADSLWDLLEAARGGFEEGHPLISVRELLAYRIVRKLAAQDKWGGEAKNKAFLWEEDLPNGGFPAEFTNRREILDVAHMLASVGVLTTKKSQGEVKYALGEKSVVQPILDNRSFTRIPQLRKYFEKDARRVSSRVLAAE